MAKIWPTYEGARPTVGEPWADLPLSDAVKLFELNKEQRVSGLEKTPRFGDEERDLTYRGYKYIVVEIGRREGQRANWKPGYYRSNIKPDEAYVKLLKHAFDSEFGQDAVLDLTYEPIIDSLGEEEALRVTVVIAPAATQRVRGEGNLNALAKLRKQLREMGNNRFPIVEYATEAELKRDAVHQS